ncbi:hypothetical protein INT47_006756 [Mucor saturninus]|uniref:Arrestin-like N-terminal domain-containing protein n=1 Tax=Mucor saturninus TaxID=64648 RepID=A0A8H7R0T4_9FUNG|nr:hypothetical protein INT47_006756 [Mucor saturninus]
MHLGLLSHGQLSFDPFKPIILRGLPTEDASTLFAGNVVLNLSKPTKISNVSVTLKSHAVTYWPEGIGARGTRLTAEKPLGEQSVEILAPNIDKKAPVLVLPAGIHRFSFAFVIPNSTVATIEDTFGRVRHVVDAEVQRPGMMVSSWNITKPVMILRTYMSNSLLVNNSLNNLSRTFEKHMVYGDIEVVIEAAAFSSGDLFYIRMIVEPQLKHTRIEHIEVNVTESRKYCVPEMRAWRTDKSVYPLPFAGSVRLAEFGEVDVTTNQLLPIFDKSQNGIELVHDFAHRLAFYAPTCQQNIRHTTYIKEILIKHHIEINVTMSYLDIQGHRQHLSRRGSIGEAESPGTLTPPPAAHLHPRANGNSTPVTWQNVLQRLNKAKAEDLHNRKKDTISLDSSVIVFDCRLKEDYGRLPSYSELGVKPSIVKEKKQDKIKLTKMDTPKNQPRPYLCPCYEHFSYEMDLASQEMFLPATDKLPAMPLLDRIPSIPPPEYSA